MSLVNGGWRIETELFAGIPDETDIEHLPGAESPAGALASPVFATQSAVFN